MVGTRYSKSHTAVKELHSFHVLVAELRVFSRAKFTLAIFFCENPKLEL